MGKWYISGIDVTQYVAIGATISERKDRTLDAGSLTLSPLSDPSPIDPRTPVSYVDGGETLLFSCVSDSVSPLSRGDSVVYSHFVQLASVSRELAFHRVRGMDFSQPKSGGSASLVLNETHALQQKSGGYAMSKGASYASVFSRGRMKAESGRATLDIYGFTLYEGEVSSGMLHKPFVSIEGIGVYCVDSGSPVLLFSLGGLGKDGDSVELTQEQISAINGCGSIKIMCPNTVSGVAIQFYGNFAVVNVRIDLSLYYYTLYDVLAGIASGCGRVKDDYSPADASPFSLPSSGDFLSFIESTPSPDFNFSQGATVWDCLSEVYDSFDAMPILLGGGVLGARYFNESGSALDESEVIARSEDISDAGSPTGLVCSYQNGASGVCVYPSSGSFAYARTKEVGVPQGNEWGIQCGMGIQSVSKAEMPIESFMLNIEVNGSFYTYSIPCLGVSLDVTDFVPEGAAYSLLSEASADTPYPTKYNSAKYDSGSDSVYLGTIDQTASGTSYAYSHIWRCALARMMGLSSSFNFSFSDDYGYANLPSADGFGSLANAPQNVRMRVSFIPVSSGALRVESPTKKGSGEEMAAQGSGLVELSKLGASMMGVSAMQGMPSKSEAMGIIHSFGDRPKRDSHSSDWVTQGVKSTFMAGGDFQCEAYLAKGFNQLSSRTKIDREIRFTSISSDVVLMSEEIYQEYLLFTKMHPPIPITFPQETHASKNAMKALASALDSSSGGWVDYPSSFPVFGYFRGSSLGSALNGCHFPVRCYGAGNAVCFEGGFSSPISAGNKLKSAPGWFALNLSSNVYRYSDPKGFVDKASVWLCPSSSASDFSSLPAIPEPSSKNVRFDGMEIGKRPNEILRFNFEVIMASYVSSPNEKRILIYRKLAEESYPSSLRRQRGLRLFLLSASDVPYSQFEGKAYGSEYAPSSSLSFSVSDAESSGFAVCLSFVLMDGASAFAAQRTCYGWMVADSSGNPIIACNETVLIRSGIDFRAFSRHNRE